MIITEAIEEIRKALEAKYEFPYYALVRIQPTHGPCFHIPAPFFNGSAKKPRSVWAGNLPIATDRRDGEYYKCPFCGETSYYAGVCQDCRRDFEEWDEDEEQWIDGELPIEYRNHEAIKKALKEELLYRLDNRIPDLGIISAEIVLPTPPSNVCGENHSPFLKSGSWNSQRALDSIEKELKDLDSIEKELKEKEEYQKMIREFQPDESIPLDYLESDVIEVDGTDEIRKHENGVWWHQHGKYTYWHPMARVHKEIKIYPLC